MYAILDIETTGLSPAKEKITEIAIFLHDGKKVIDEYSTLIHPEKKIPYRIIQMTGISNRMVENAPRFFEVVGKIMEFTEGAVIVGHNVRFDYSFIRQEFLRLGFAFQRETLDTVKLRDCYEITYPFRLVLLPFFFVAKVLNKLWLFATFAS